MGKISAIAPEKIRIEFATCDRAALGVLFDSFRPSQGIYRIMSLTLWEQLAKGFANAEIMGKRKFRLNIRIEYAAVLDAIVGSIPAFMYLTQPVKQRIASVLHHDYLKQFL